jgi:hypothetical protein
VVCHPSPGASRPVLVRDLLTALGKHRDALARERRVRDGPALLRVWLRAENVAHLVVTRAHLLRPGLLDELARLATIIPVTVWLVRHHRDPPPGTSTAVAPRSRCRGDAPPRRSPRADSPRRCLGQAYRNALVAARLPVGCGPATADHRRRHRAASAGPCHQDGFMAEGLMLSLPAAAPSALAALGPRPNAAVLARLRRIVRPTSAAALMLALATDAEARCLAGCSPRWVTADSDQVGLLPGAYRIPARARPLLRAALIAHHGQPGHTLLLDRGGRLFLDQRMAANLVDVWTGRTGA